MRCWAFAAAAQTGADAAYGRLASDNYSDIEAGIAGLATSGDPKAGAVLRALTDGRLLYRPDDKALAVKDGATATDARTGAAVNPRASSPCGSTTGSGARSTPRSAP